MHPDVLAAIEVAMRAHPASTPLVKHYCELLVRCGRAPEALERIAGVLAASPSDVEALHIAAAAARLCGEDERAAGYEELVFALGSVDAPMIEDDDAAPAPFDDVAISDQEMNAFLEDVLGPSSPVVTLDDVGGLENVKRRLQDSFLTPLRNPELREAYGSNLRGGLLLYGPPGCGKTFVARAIAGELGAKFLSVGLHDVLSMWHGESEHKLHELFETARRNAPCVLFFDEVDALGQKRSSSAPASRGVVAQLLSELDSLGSDNEGLFVLGATNQPWDVDSALRRPGRFDHTLLVLPPDLEAREVILNKQLAHRPTGLLSLSVVAERTEGYSGADLQLLVKEASGLAMQEAMRLGSVVPIATEHLLRAATDVNPSVGPWFETATNYATYANADGAYDDLAAYVKRRRIGFRRKNT